MGGESKPCSPTPLSSMPARSICHGSAFWIITVLLLHCFNDVFYGFSGCYPASMEKKHVSLRPKDATGHDRLRPRDHSHRPLGVLHPASDCAGLIQKGFLRLSVSVCDKRWIVVWHPTWDRAPLRITTSSPTHCCIWFFRFRCRYYLPARIINPAVVHPGPALYRPCCACLYPARLRAHLDLAGSLECQTWPFKSAPSRHPLTSA